MKIWLTGPKEKALCKYVLYRYWPLYNGRHTIFFFCGWSQNFPDNNIKNSVPQAFKASSRNMPVYFTRTKRILFHIKTESRGGGYGRSKKMNGLNEFLSVYCWVFPLYTKERRKNECEEWRKIRKEKEWEKKLNMGGEEPSKQKKKEAK